MNIRCCLVEYLFNVIYYFLLFSMVLSRPAFERIAHGSYKCKRPETPDDMWLGNIHANLGIPLYHINSFHQVFMHFFHAVPLDSLIPH